MKSFIDSLVLDLLKYVIMILRVIEYLVIFIFIMKAQAYGELDENSYFEYFKQNPHKFREIVNRFYDLGEYEKLYKLLRMIDNETNFFNVSAEIIKIGASLGRDINQDLEKAITKYDVSDIACFEVFRKSGVISNFVEYLVKNLKTNEVLISKFSYIVFNNGFEETIIYLLENGIFLDITIVQNAIKKFYGYREYEKVVMIFNLAIREIEKMERETIMLISDALIKLKRYEEVLKLLQYREETSYFRLLRVRALLGLGDIQEAQNEIYPIMYTSEGTRLALNIFLNVGNEKEFYNLINRADETTRIMYDALFKCIHKGQILESSRDLRSFFSQPSKLDDKTKNIVSLSLYFMNRGKTKEEVSNDVLFVVNAYEGVNNQSVLPSNELRSLMKMGVLTL